MKSLFLTLLFSLLFVPCATVVAAPAVQTAEEPPAITSAAAATFTVGVPGSFTVTTTGYPTATLTLSGTLPSGLSFLDNGDGTGTVSGTPVAGTGGDYRLRADMLSPIGVDVATFPDTNVDGIPDIPGLYTLAMNSTGPNDFQFLSLAPDCSPMSSAELANQLLYPLAELQVFAGESPCVVVGFLASYEISDALIYNIENRNLLMIPLYDRFDGSGSNTRAHIVGFALLRLTGFYFSAGQNWAMTRAECTVAGGYASRPQCISAEFLASSYAPCQGDACANFHAFGTWAEMHASNGVSPDATQLLKFTVNEESSFIISDTVEFRAGVSQIITGTLRGFPLPTVTVASGILPTSITLKSAPGVINFVGNPSAAVRGAYPITLNAHNAIGVDATRNLTVMVNQPPVITSANLMTFTVGTAGAFTVTTMAYPTPTLSLSPHVPYGRMPFGLTFTDNGDGTGTISGTPEPETGCLCLFVLYAHNGVAPDAEQPLTMPIYEAPYVDPQPSDVTVFDGQVASFGTVGRGMLPPSIQWQLSTDDTTWDDISGAVTNIYTFTAHLADNGNQYRAVMTNSLGSATTNAARLTVYQLPYITSQPNDVKVIDGEAANFTAMAGGAPAPSVQWQVSSDGTTWSDVSGAVTNTLTFTAHLADNGNQYRAAFSNAEGTAVSNVAHLAVTFTPIAIRGHVFSDLNGNGVGDTKEIGLPNWTVRLTEISSNVVVTTTTDTAGNYAFTNVGPGTYRVRPVLPTGWMQTTADPADMTAQNAVDVSGVNFGVVLPADLALAFAASPEPATVGTNVAYTLTVANQGPNIARTIQMTTTVPVSTTLVSLTIPSGWLCPRRPAVGASGAILCKRTGMATGGTSVFNFVVRGKSTLADSSIVPNSARVSSTIFDSNPSNNAARVSTTLVKRADVSIAQSAVVNSTRTIIVYTMTIRNLGPAIAKSVIVKDSLAASTALRRVTTTRGLCSGTTTVRCNLGLMGPGSVATVTISVRLLRPVTEVKNTVYVTTASPDPIQENNVATILLDVSNP